MGLESGRAGEAVAAAWLERRGYLVEEKNYRSFRGEIDIIAWKGDVLVFTEVRARGPGSLAGPAESVDARKRARIVRAAKRYLLKFGSRPPLCRFDVIEVAVGARGAGEVRHLPDAFRPGWA